MIEPAVLERQAEISPLQMLSAPPCFDFELGEKLVELAAPNEPRGEREYLSNAITGGLVERAASLYRVPDPFGRQLRHTLREADAGVYKDALALFLGYADSSMMGSMRSLFGPVGQTVVRETFRVIASPDPSKQFHILEELLEDNGAAGRWSDHAASALILETYGDPNDRITTYVKALSAWHSGDRRRGAAGFEYVLAFGEQDRIAGISGHLLGTFMHDVGKTREALQILAVASSLLDSLNDNYGFAVTTSTSARVVLDRYRSLRDPDDLTLSRQLALTAVTRAINAECNASTAACGRMKAAALIGLANVLVEAEEYPAAIDAATEGSGFSRGGSLNSLKAGQVKSRALRNLKRDPEAAETLRDALVTFRAYRPDDVRNRAMALNVLASIYKSFDLDRAESAIRESLELGESIRDTRHVAHALMNMVQIGIIRLNSTDSEPVGARAEIRRLKGLLFRAREKLQEVDDPNGVRRVLETLAELDAMQLVEWPHATSAISVERSKRRTKARQKDHR